MTSTNELLTDFPDLIIDSFGAHTEFDHTAGFESADKDSLVFIQCAEQMPARAAVIVTSMKVANELRGHTQSFLACVDDVRLAQARMKQRYHDYQSVDQEWDAVHDSAVIHKSSTLSKGCHIGPGVVIGANCVLGENVIVRANATIEHNVTIGHNSTINGGAIIGYATQIGERVTVQSNAVIGTEGFGFAVDKTHKYHRIPHTGHVMLEDDVHVGANTCIDRATYGVTRIARGVKIDNLVHIAHNVDVGEDTLLTAQTCIAGSSKIGKRVIASGQAGVLDHKTVADGVILVQRCGVTDDIPTGGMWAGTPAKPFKEYVRGLGLGKKVARLEQKLKELQSRMSDGD